MLEVTLPDGSTRSYSGSVTPLDVAAEIGPGLAKAALAAKVDGKTVGLDTPLPATGNVELALLTKKDPEALGVMRHSCAHVMARAVMRLFDGVQLAFGPTIDNGFYYDFGLEHHLTEEDFRGDRGRDGEDRQGEGAVRAARAERAARRSSCAATCTRSLKVEHIEDKSAERPRPGTTCFRSTARASFVDLCRGPHVPHAGVIGNGFKLLSVAGAYWKGRQHARPQLQRLYATAFFDKKELQEALGADRGGEETRSSRARQTVASVPYRRDGRPGPDSLDTRRRVSSASRCKTSSAIALAAARATNRCSRRMSASSTLYKTSGHFPYYQESQYPPLIDREHLQQLADEGC